MGHGAAGISCRGIAERFLGFFVRERMQQRHAARERFLCSGGARHRKIDGSERSIRSVGPMLLLAQDFAIERQQQAEGPEQCDCAFACFSHVWAPDGFSFAVDGSALDPEGQSTSGSCIHSIGSPTSTKWGIREPKPCGPIAHGVDFSPAFAREVWHGPYRSLWPDSGSM